MPQLRKLTRDQKILLSKMGHDPKAYLRAWPREGSDCNRLGGVHDESMEAAQPFSL